MLKAQLPLIKKIILQLLFILKIEKGHYARFDVYIYQSYTITLYIFMRERERCASFLQSVDAHFLENVL